MSRQGNIISTVLYFCKENNIEKGKAVQFASEVLQDAGQIETDEDGEISESDKQWLSQLVEKYLATDSPAETLKR